MTEPTVASPSAPATKPAALWEDFVDVFTQPSAVFARRRDGRFGAPLLVLTLLMAAVFFATRPMLQPLFDRQFDAQAQAMERSNPNMSEEQRASARAMSERVSTVFVPIAAFIGTPILVLITGALAWGAGRMVGAKLTYGQATTAAIYANVPRAVGGIVGAALLSVKDASELPLLQSAPTGPVFFLSSDASPILVALLARFDVFTLWTTVLLGIGIAVMARTTRSKGLTAAALVWLVALVWGVLSALRTQAAMGG